MITIYRCLVCNGYIPVDIVPRLTTVRVRTDFYEQYPGSGLATEIAMCNDCGLCAPTGWWRETVKLPHPANMETKLPATPDERYARCAQLAATMGVVECVQGDLWLRASWAAYQADDLEAERYYQKHAISHLGMAYADPDTTIAEGYRYAYLLGELNRRVEDSGWVPHSMAEIWFARVRPDAPRWLYALTAQQRTAPRDWFTPDSPLRMTD